MKNKKVEQYWSNVGQRMAERSKNAAIIAGDHDYYYQYKRTTFLKKFTTLVNWKDQAVLEYGCGPGGNLNFLSSQGVRSLTGVDISDTMLSLAHHNLSNVAVPLNLVNNNGIEIPLDSQSVDNAFSATVLQHNTSDENVFHIIKEMCRVARKKVILCEHTNLKTRQLHDHFVGRTLDSYTQMVTNHGFTLAKVEYLNIHVSYLILGSIRKFLNSKQRKEGESLHPFSLQLQKAFLPLTQKLDPLFPKKQDLTLMVFERKV